MPLVDLSSNQAVANRKGNPQASWGERSAKNRVEPVAKPRFDVPFKLEPSDAIFTIGSCFARNVEQELARRGFRLPMREVFDLPEFEGLERGIVNNYATPSIFNEIAWAFGEAPYDADALLAQIQPGKYADLNFMPNLRADTLEVVQRRRAAVNAAYRSSAQCRVVIMTLGLSEVWFDQQSQTYLNVSPRPSLLKNQPERFRLHVLTWEESYGSLRKALDILAKHGRADQQVVLTVSPVPLTATHRDQDVLVANMYSKSLLRAVAETICVERHNVTYFPSYESFLLSDRKLAFIDDLVHPHEALVAFNVGRMVDAYTGKPSSNAELDRIISESAIDVRDATAARVASEVSEDLASDFFEAHGHRSATSVDFAKEHARHLIRTGNGAAAIQVLEGHPPEDVERIALLTEALVLDGQPQKALDLIDSLPQGRVKATRLWDQLFEAALRSGDPSHVMSVLTRIRSNVRGRAPLAYMRAARFFRDRGDRGVAEQLYAASLDLSATNIAAIEYADLLIQSAKWEPARQALALVSDPLPAHEQRKNVLLGMLSTV